MGVFSELVASLAEFAVIQQLLGPFQRLDRTARSYQSRSRFHGWRMGVLIGSCFSAAILLFNVTVVIVIARMSGFKGDSAELPFFYDSPTM
jgi:hypothetical protein